MVNEFTELQYTDIQGSPKNGTEIWEEISPELFELIGLRKQLSESVFNYLSTHTLDLR